MAAVRKMIVKWAEMSIILDNPIPEGPIFLNPRMDRANALFFGFYPPSKSGGSSSQMWYLYAKSNWANPYA